MALTVSTAPQYSGNSRPYGDSSTATLPGGYLQGAPVQIQGSGTPTYDTSGGGVLGATTTAGVAAPTGPSAAQIAETNRIAGVTNNTNVAQTGLVAGANQSRADNTLKYGNDSSDFTTQIQGGQNQINTGRANNQLNLRRSMSGIALGIRQGIRSGGVSLANMNALDSGAADAMARAYATTGNSQAADASNQAQLKENEFNGSQTTLDQTKASGLNKLHGWRQNETNRVSQKLWDDLASLDASASAQGAGGVVDMGARDRVISQAASELDAIDAITNNSLQQLHGYTPDEARAKALEMDNAGQVAAPFTVETAQGGFQSPSGPALGQFGVAPVFRKDQQTGLV